MKLLQKDDGIKLKRHFNEKWWRDHSVWMFKRNLLKQELEYIDKELIKQERKN